MTQNAELERIKRLIRELTQRTETNGCTEAEAESAMQHVGRLLHQYNLNMSEIDIRRESCCTLEVDRPNRHPLWQSTMVALSRFCDCLVWRKYRSGYALFGFPGDTQLAAWLIDRIGEAAETGYAAFRQTLYYQSSRNKKRLFANFHHALGARLSTRFDVLRKERIQKQRQYQSSGTDLIVLKSQTVADAFAQTGVRLTRRTVYRSIDVDGYAQSEGQGVAETIQLNRPIDSAPIRPLLS